MEAKEETYRATIECVMPGQTKPGVFHIDVKAESRVEALAAAEVEWRTATDKIAVKIAKIDPVKVAS